MQAMIMFTLFGAILAIFGGIATTSVDSISQFIDNQVRETKSYFRRAEVMMTEQWVPAFMETPYGACPDGNSYGAENIRSYLCQPAVSALAQWSGAQGGIVDPWKNEFIGYVLRKEVPIYAAAPANLITVPVTAMVLASAGPDRRFSPQVETAINNLTELSQIRDVMVIAAPNPTTCTVAVNGSCDDIVHVFTDQRSQERRWKAVQSAVDRIIAGTLREYHAQFKVFLSQLPALYAANSSQLFDGSGQFVINDENMNLWQGVGINPPSLTSIDLNDAEARKLIGVDKEFAYITESVADGGSSLAISFGVTNSTNGYRDVLTVTLGNASSPWGQWETMGGLIQYQKVVEAGNPE